MPIFLKINKYIYLILFLYNNKYHTDSNSKKRKNNEKQS
jgi:hypothetical protein